MVTEAINLISDEEKGVRGGGGFVRCDFMVDGAGWGWGAWALSDVILWQIACVCMGGGVYGVRAGEFVSHDWKRGDSFV